MEQMTNHPDLLKLRQTQKSILEGLDAKISQLERYVSDYKAVDQLLTDLPKRLSHSSTMIPFSGKKALVPAILENTNEVMVYLGSDLFATVSAYHCRGIVDRRLEALTTQVKASKEERRLVRDRLVFTNDILRERSSESAKEGLVEIREEISEEDEARWQERHRRLMVEERRQMGAASRKEDGRSERELLQRLEELERLEAVEEDRQLKPILRKEPKSGKKSKNLKRRVSFHGLEQPSKTPPVKEEEDEDDEEEESASSVFIRFHHTPNISSASSDVTPASLISHCTVRSPAGDVRDASAITDVVVERPMSGYVSATTPVEGVVIDEPVFSNVADSKSTEETTSRPKSRFRVRREKND